MAYENQNSSNFQKTQESIVRQSSLKFVAEYCQINNLRLSLMETLRITNWITNYCLNGSTEDLERNIKAIDEYLLNKEKKSSQKKNPVVQTLLENKDSKVTNTKTNPLTMEL